MTIKTAAKNNSKLTDFDGLRDVVIDHISKVRMIQVETKEKPKENSRLCEWS